MAFLKVNMSKINRLFAYFHALEKFFHLLKFNIVFFN